MAFVRQESHPLDPGLVSQDLKEMQEKSNSAVETMKCEWGSEDSTQAWDSLAYASSSNDSHGWNDSHGNDSGADSPSRGCDAEWPETRYPPLKKPFIDYALDIDGSPRSRGGKRRQTLIGTFIPWRFEEHLDDRSRSSSATTDVQQDVEVNAPGAETLESNFDSEQALSQGCSPDSDDEGSFEAMRIQGVDEAPEITWPDTDDEAQIAALPPVRGAPQQPASALQLDAMLPQSFGNSDQSTRAEVAKQMFMQELASKYVHSGGDASRVHLAPPFTPAMPSPARQPVAISLAGAISTHGTQALSTNIVGCSSGATVEDCSEEDWASSMQFNMSVREWPPTHEDVEDFGGCSNVHNDALGGAQPSRSSFQPTIFASTPPPQLQETRPEQGRNVYIEAATTAATESVLNDTHADHTTVMLRNLPLDLTQHRLIEELNLGGFKGCYDFCYMPCCFNSACGKGFAFLNLVSPDLARDFIASWHGTQRFGLLGAGLNISYAVIQGLDANLAKWNTARMHRVRNPNLRPFVAEQRVEEQRRRP